MARVFRILAMLLALVVSCGLAPVASAQGDDGSAPVTRLSTALDTDFASVAQVFANDDQGYAFRFDSLAGSLLDEDGLIDSRVDGLNSRVRRLEDEQAESTIVPPASFQLGLGEGIESLPVVDARERIPIG